MVKNLELYTKEEKEELKKVADELSKTDLYLMMRLRYHAEIKKIDMSIEFAKRNNSPIKLVNRLEVLKQDLINSFGYLFQYENNL